MILGHVASGPLNYCTHWIAICTPNKCHADGVVLSKTRTPLPQIQEYFYLITGISISTSAAVQSGSSIAGPGGTALARALSHNCTLASLNLFWAELDLPSLRDIACMLAGNSALTSLALGDPATLADAEACEAARRVLAHAGPAMKRLSLAYVPLPSLPAAQAFCAALEGNAGALSRLFVLPSSFFLLSSFFFFPRLSRL